MTITINWDVNGGDWWRAVFARANASARERNELPGAIKHMLALRELATGERRWRECAHDLGDKAKREEHDKTCYVPTDRYVCDVAEAEAVLAWCRALPGWRRYAQTDIDGQIVRDKRGVAAAPAYPLSFHRRSMVDPDEA